MKNEVNNVLICGLGAIGTVYAVKIQDAKNKIKDLNLKILLDEKRITKYQDNPTIFNDKEYSFDFITPNNNSYKADLIIIATKNNGLDDAIYNIKNFIHEKTIILSLLNGIQSEDKIASVYGYEKILYSYYIGHTSTRKGRNIEHDNVNKLVFGEIKNNVNTEKIKRLTTFFEKTNINYEIPKDMNYSRWWKFLVNIGYNQASAVLDAPYGAFQQIKKVNNIAIKLMEEAATIAKAEGVKNTENLIPEVLDVIKNMLPETKTSMLQDVLAKRKTEIDIFAGYVCQLGKKHNIPTPYNTMFYEIISAIDLVNKTKINNQ